LLPQQFLLPLGLGIIIEAPGNLRNTDNE